jgi:hypothetical protein
VITGVRRSPPDDGRTPPACLDSVPCDRLGASAPPLHPSARDAHRWPVWPSRSSPLRRSLEEPISWALWPASMATPSRSTSATQRLCSPQRRAVVRSRAVRLPNSPIRRPVGAGQDAREVARERITDLPGWHMVRASAVRSLREPAEARLALTTARHAAVRSMLSMALHEARQKSWVSQRRAQKQAILGWRRHARLRAHLDDVVAAEPDGIARGRGRVVRPTPRWSTCGPQPTRPNCESPVSGASLGGRGRI